MNRMQKKCVIATAGFHLLLLVILFVGPAFFNANPKVDDSHVLDVIPAILVDAAINTGVRAVQPPAPTPIVTPSPQPITPTPVAVPTPAPVPVPEKIEPLKPPTPKISLVPVIRNVPKNSITQAKPKPDNSKAVNSALTALRTSLSHATKIDVPGDSGAAVANYESVVKSVYNAAWTLPDSIINVEENAQVKVTIASDGTVISAHIITPSGDTLVDETVQRALDRVRFVAPFPEGMTKSEWSCVLDFNPETKKMSE